MRRQLDRWLFGVGAVCLLSAIVAGSVKAFGLELPVVDSVLRQVLLATLGLAVMAASFFFRTDSLSIAPTRQFEDTSEPIVPVSGAIPRPTPYFTGREQLLDELHTMLDDQGLVVLTGLGGVGKTQLTIAYIRMHRRIYDVVWWIRAAEESRLAEDYASLGDHEGLREQSDEIRSRVAAVRHWLEARGHWLLVFDDADDASTLQSYLPSQQTGHIIVTSRSRLWHEAATLEVKPWSKIESVAFVRSYTAADGATAKALAVDLGCLPLALEQARAYLQETSRSVPEYLNELRARSAELFAHGTPARYEYTVATTWSISLQRVQEEAAAAEQLLAIWAFLAPEDLPRALLVAHADQLPKRLGHVVSDTMTYDQTIGVLERYSLIAVTQDALSMHRLVHAVVRAHVRVRDQRAGLA